MRTSLTFSFILGIWTAIGCAKGLDPELVLPGTTGGATSTGGGGGALPLGGEGGAGATATGGAGLGGTGTGGAGTGATGTGGSGTGAAGTTGGAGTGGGGTGGTTGGEPCDVSNPVCPITGQWCQSGICGCAENSMVCDGACVYAWDDANCGACGVTCIQPQYCQQAQGGCASPP